MSPEKFNEQSIAVIGWVCQSSVWEFEVSN